MVSQVLAEEYLEIIDAPKKVFPYRNLAKLKP